MLFLLTYARFLCAASGPLFVWTCQVSQGALTPGEDLVNRSFIRSVFVLLILEHIDWPSFVVTNALFYIIWFNSFLQRDLTPPYVDDGFIEVVGFRDAWHGLILFAPKGHGTRLAQVSRKNLIEILLYKLDSFVLFLSNRRIESDLSSTKLQLIIHSCESMVSHGNSLFPWMTIL